MSKINFEDLELVKKGKKNLGTGAYASVKLVRHKPTGKKYALKEIDLNSATKEDLINIEREIHSHQKIDHPNIIKFFGFKREGKKVMILLEYAEKGDLFNHLNKKGGFPVKEACKYFTQTALALQHIHSCKLIHRDIKPENLLLDRNYNIKLCDFGWSAEYDEELRRETVCGTYEYMAPEILFHKQQTTGIDIWALGILLYELLHNKAPYSGRSMSDVKKKIITSTIKFMPKMDPDAKDLIQKILRVKNDDRPSIKQILAHPFVMRYYDGEIKLSSTPKTKKSTTSVREDRSPLETLSSFHRKRKNGQKHRKRSNILNGAKLFSKKARSPENREGSICSTNTTTRHKLSPKLAPSGGSFLNSRLQKKRRKNLRLLKNSDSSKRLHSIAVPDKTFLMRGTVDNASSHISEKNYSSNPIANHLRDSSFSSGKRLLIGSMFQKRSFHDPNFGTCGSRVSNNTSTSVADRSRKKNKYVALGNYCSSKAAGGIGDVLGKEFAPNGSFLGRGSAFNTQGGSPSVLKIKQQKQAQQQHLESKENISQLGSISFIKNSFHEKTPKLRGSEYINRLNNRMKTNSFVDPRGSVTSSHSLNHAAFRRVNGGGTNQPSFHRAAGNKGSPKSKLMVALRNKQRNFVNRMNQHNRSKKSLHLSPHSVSSKLTGLPGINSANKTRNNSQTLYNLTSYSERKKSMKNNLEELLKVRGVGGIDPALRNAEIINNTILRKSNNIRVSPSPTPHINNTTLRPQQFFSHNRRLNGMLSLKHDHPFKAGKENRSNVSPTLSKHTSGSKTRSFARGVAGFNFATKKRGFVLNKPFDHAKLDYASHGKSKSILSEFGQQQ